MNTSLQAFAMGSPVVTLPKGFQRGRHVLGMYRRMGWLDLVALRYAVTVNGLGGLAVTKAIDSSRNGIYELALSHENLIYSSRLENDRAAQRESSQRHLATAHLSPRTVGGLVEKSLNKPRKPRPAWLGGR